MKPVFQEIIDQGTGDCFSACLASLLELPIGEVPKFNRDAVQSGSTHPILDAETAKMVWLAARGISLLRLPEDDVRDWRSLPGQYCILSMPSQRFPGGQHAVIGQYQSVNEHEVRLVVVHDPNPGNAPYPPEVVPSMVNFLLHKSPA